MAGSVNKIIVIGNVGKDPEVRKNKAGKEYVTFSVATSETWKDRSGERQQETTWHNITVYAEGLVKVSRDYIRKGSKVYVEGTWKTYKYAKEGREAIGHHIVVNPFGGSITLLDGKDDRGGGEDARAPNDDRFDSSRNRSSGSASGSSPGGADPALDDDIPF